MLTVHGREIPVLGIAAVGVSISTIVAFLAIVICSACKTRKPQQEADISGRPAPPPRSNGGGEARRLPSTATGEEVEMMMGQQAAQTMPLLCRYLKADGWQDATCGVCLVELADGDVLRVLPPCMHYFHAACVSDWIRFHATCPYCRGPIAAACRHM